jgi:hypothetical protein
MAIPPSVNVTWDSFTPSEVDMAKVASFPSIMLQRFDMCLERLDDFQQALRAPSVMLQVFSGEILWNLKRRTRGLEKLQFLSSKS